MTTAVIIDMFVVVFLLAFTIYGAKRGLLQALAGLVIFVVALVGAGMIAASFSAPAAKVVAPLLREQVSDRVEAALEEQLETSDWAETNSETVQIRDLLKRLGMEESNSLTEQIRSSMANTGAALVDAVAEAVIEPLVQSVLYGVLYLLSFLVLLLLLHVLLKAMGLVMKLPGLHLLNSLGGGLLGLIQGALLLFLAAWVGRRLGISLDTELLAEAHILRIFTTYTPLSVLSFLQ